MSVANEYGLLKYLVSDVMSARLVYVAVGTEGCSCCCWVEGRGDAVAPEAVRRCSKSLYSFRPFIHIAQELWTINLVFGLSHVFVLKADLFFSKKLFT